MNVDAFFNGNTLVLRRLVRSSGSAIGYALHDEELEQGFFFLFVVDSFKCTILSILGKHPRIHLRDCSGFKRLLKNSNLLRAVVVECVISKNFGTQRIRNVSKIDLVPSASMVMISSNDIFALKEACFILHKNLVSRGDLYSYVPVEMLEVNLFLWNLVNHEGGEIFRGYGWLDNFRIGALWQEKDHFYQRLQDELELKRCEGKPGFDYERHLRNMEKRPSEKRENLPYMDSIKARQSFVCTDNAGKKWSDAHMLPFNITNAGRKISQEQLSTIFSRCIPHVSILYTVGPSGKFSNITMVLRVDGFVSLLTILVASTDLEHNEIPEKDNAAVVVTKLVLTEQDLFHVFFHEYCYGNFFLRNQLNNKTFHFLCGLDLKSFKQKLFTRCCILGIDFLDKIMQFNLKKMALLIPNSAMGGFVYDNKTAVPKKTNQSNLATGGVHKNGTPTAVPSVFTKLVMHASAVEIPWSWDSVWTQIRDGMVVLKDGSAQLRALQGASRLVVSTEIDFYANTLPNISNKEGFSKCTKFFKVKDVSFWTLSHLIDNITLWATAMANTIAPLMVGRLLEVSMKSALFPGSVSRMSRENQMDSAWMMTCLQEGAIPCVNFSTQWEPVLKIPRLPHTLHHSIETSFVQWRNLSDVLSADMITPFNPVVCVEEEFISNVIWGKGKTAKKQDAKTHSGTETDTPLPKSCIVQRSFTLTHKLLLNTIYALKSLTETCAFVPTKLWAEYLNTNTYGTIMCNVGAIVMVPMTQNVQFSITDKEIAASGLWRNPHTYFLEDLHTSAVDTIGVFVSQLSGTEEWDRMCEKLRDQPHAVVNKTIFSALKSSVAGEFFARFFYHAILQYTLRIIPYIWNLSVYEFNDNKDPKIETLQSEVAWLFETHGKWLHFFSKRTPKQARPQSMALKQTVVVNYANQDVVNFSVSTTHAETGLLKLFLHKMNQHFVSLVFPRECCKVFAFKKTSIYFGARESATPPVDTSIPGGAPKRQKVDEQAEGAAGHKEDKRVDAAGCRQGYNVVIFTAHKVFWLNHRCNYKLDSSSNIYNTFEELLFLVMSGLSREESWPNITMAMEGWLKTRNLYPMVWCQTHGNYRTPMKKSHMLPYDGRWMYFHTDNKLCNEPGRMTSQFSYKEFFNFFFSYYKKHTIKIIK